MRNLESYPVSLLFLAITLLLSVVPVADATPTLYDDLHARGSHCWEGCRKFFFPNHEYVSNIDYCT
jgi:hypothetical protein